MGDVILIVSLPRIPWGRTPDAVALLLGLLKRNRQKEGNAVSLRRRFKSNGFFSAFVDVTKYPPAFLNRNLTNSTPALPDGGDGRRHIKVLASEQSCYSRCKTPCLRETLSTALILKCGFLLKTGFLLKCTREKTELTHLLFSSLILAARAKPLSILELKYQLHHRLSVFSRDDERVQSVGFAGPQQTFPVRSSLNTKRPFHSERERYSTASKHTPISTP